MDTREHWGVFARDEDAASGERLIAVKDDRGEAWTEAMRRDGQAFDEDLEARGLSLSEEKKDDAYSEEWAPMYHAKRVSPEQVAEAGL